MELTLDDFDALAPDVPTLLDLQPSGRYLMEDFCYAGGLPAVMRELGERACCTATRSPSPAAPCRERRRRAVLEPRGHPRARRAVPAGRDRHRGAARQPRPGRGGPQAVRRLAHLLKHRGRALVFDTPEAYYAVVADPDLDADEDTVLVIRYCGPRGYPGMPEVANVPLPARLLKRGVTRHGADLRRPDVRHRLRHRRPARRPRGRGRRAARPGPHRRLDPLDVPSRTLTLEVPDDELAARRPAWTPPPPHASRGWTRLYTEHVQQADTGCDLDFLIGGSGHEVGRDSH